MAHPLPSTRHRPALQPIPADTFTMGSPEDEAGRTPGEHPRVVPLTRPFWMMATPVTGGQWRRLLSSEPSYFTRDDTLPVECVNWFEAVAFANALSLHEGLDPAYLVEGATGTLGGGVLDGEGWGEGDFQAASVILRPESDGYCLPTEAEWEYAARAGTTGALYAGEWALIGEHHAPALDPIAWYGGNSGVDHPEGIDSDWFEMQQPAPRSATHPVGRKQPNPWGLHDMLGNVWEWCEDWHFEAPHQDPRPTGHFRVVRGGAWYAEASRVRAASRMGVHPAFRANDRGFRLVRCTQTPPGTTAG